MDGVEVPAGVQCAEVWPEVAVFVAVLGVFAEGEDANVSRAHQIDSDGLDTVIYRQE